MRALIIEPRGDRGSLAATRALSRAGWTVGVASSAKPSLAGRSRFAASRHRVPGAQEGVDRFVAAVNAAIADGGYEIVFCGAGDAEVTALSRCRGEIAATVPYPPHEIVLRALDKLELARAAERVGLPAATTIVATVEELDRWMPPFVVKARAHAPLADDVGPSRLEATIVADRAAAERRVDEIRALGGDPVFQEMLPGALVAFAAVADSDSRIIACAQQAADATWPPGAGVSARARTTPVDQGLAAQVEALLAELGWVGLAELQFLGTADGGLELIDFNGRFYGSLALAISAGPNLPAIWAALATGRKPPRTVAARPGVRYQWLEGDVRRAIAERRGGIAADLAGTLRFAPGATHSTWSVADPGPALVAAGALAVRAAKLVRRSARVEE